MGKQWKQWLTLFWGAPKSLQMATAAMKLTNACSLEEKLWQAWTAYKKTRNIILPTKVHLIKAMIFPIVIYGCESWTTKKAERWRIDAFELWCWIRLLRVPWTAKRSNQSILKEISPGCSLEGLMWSWKSNTLANWSEELNHWKRPWCWWIGGWGAVVVVAGGERDDRGWDGWMASLTLWSWVWVNSGSWWWTGWPGVLWSMECKESDTTKWLNWTEHHVQCQDGWSSSWDQECKKNINDLR